MGLEILATRPNVGSATFEAVDDVIWRVVLGITYDRTANGIGTSITNAVNDGITCLYNGNQRRSSWD